MGEGEGRGGQYRGNLVSPARAEGGMRWQSGKGDAAGDIPCQCNALAGQVEEIMESPLGSSLCAREEERLDGLRGFLLYPG